MWLGSIALLSFRFGNDSANTTLIAVRVAAEEGSWFEFQCCRQAEPCFAPPSLGQAVLLLETLSMADSLLNARYAFLNAFENAQQQKRRSHYDHLLFTNAEINALRSVVQFVLWNVLST